MSLNMGNCPFCTEHEKRIGELEEEHALDLGIIDARDQRLATLEAMVEGALAIFDLHLNTPETQALRAQWKEISVDAPKPQE